MPGNSPSVETLPRPGSEPGSVSVGVEIRPVAVVDSYTSVTMAGLDPIERQRSVPAIDIILTPAVPPSA